MLSVTQFKPKDKRSTEHAVEVAWAATWKDLGIYSRHMSDKIPGLPDRYIRGGHWVEFKSLWRVRGGFTYGEGLTTEQKRTCADLTRAGDQVFYCAQLDGWEHGKRYIFKNWSDIADQLGQPINHLTDTWPGTKQSREMLSDAFR
jgi:hypothetical protein